MTNSIKIKAIEQNDLIDVARIHLAAFPESIFSKLGLECARRYYLWQLISSDQVYPIAAFSGDKLLGYCFGGVFTMALGGFIRQNKGFLLGRLMLRPWLIFHPAFLGKLTQGLRLLLKFTFRDPSMTRSRNVINSHFGILAIASDPEARGLGVGKLLMSEATRQARGDGFKSMRLTVSKKNLNAIQFYEHIGWKKDPAGDTWQGSMVTDLDDVE